MTVVVMNCMEKRSRSSLERSPLNFSGFYKTNKMSMITKQDCSDAKLTEFRYSKGKVHYVNKSGGGEYYEASSTGL